jgi:hypothetical protein
MKEPENVGIKDATIPEIKDFITHSDDEGEKPKSTKKASVAKASVGKKAPSARKESPPKKAPSAKKSTEKKAASPAKNIETIAAKKVEPTPV